jgi:hypothetical protein
VDDTGFVDIFDGFEDDSKQICGIAVGEVERGRQARRRTPYAS